MKKRHKQNIRIKNSEINAICRMSQMKYIKKKQKIIEKNRDRIKIDFQQYLLNIKNIFFKESSF